MSGAELIGLCVGLSAISQVIVNLADRVITSTRRSEQFVTREELKRDYPTKEYVDGEHKLLHQEIRGLRSDMRLIQNHRPLPPLDEDV